jgi:anhydro-N-acetylmuramic acid kinase
VSELYIGLMSGTSMDGVDGILADFSQGRLRLLGHASGPLGQDLKSALMALNRSGPDELHRAALAANALVRVYANVVRELLAGSGVNSSEVQAIGAHGQTVRHRPQCFDGVGYTLQLNNPALLAELSRIAVVADFRSRDVAAGGQGAPLVPAFHREVFAQPGKSLAVLNVGGISNLSVLAAHSAESGGSQGVIGFDCGPGNVLMDMWCLQRTGQPFDAAGRWATTGQVLPGLLAQLLDDPFFALPPPKSTGRDLFNPEWLERKLHPFRALRSEDVQATLTELTARSCGDAVHAFAPGCETLIVCGGGALNAELMRRLGARLPALQVASSADYGLAPQQVEATAFAWLARKALRRETANLCTVTGARAHRVLGAIYPA